MRSLLPVAQFLAEIAARQIPRVPGTAAFLTRAKQDTPPVMRWHVEHNRALHEHVLVLNIATLSVPWVDAARQLQLTQEAPNFWRVAMQVGFMQRPDIPKLLQQLPHMGCSLPLNDMTYYVGHETIVSRADGLGLPRWQQRLYTAMNRNAMHITDYFSLPGDQVVEIGRQISI